MMDDAVLLVESSSKADRLPSTASSKLDDFWPKENEKDSYLPCPPFSFLRLWAVVTS